MQLLQSELRLVNLDFTYMYYQAPTILEFPHWYEREVSELAPEPVHDLFGKRLSLLEEKPVKPVYEAYLVQIVNSTKLWVRDFQEHHDEVPRHLHEMLVNIWGLQGRLLPGHIGDHELKVTLKNLKTSKRIFIILDEPFEVDASHCYERHHLAALVTKEELDHVEADHQYLREEIEALLTFGSEIWIGQTVQQRHENQQIHDKATKQCDRCFDSVSYAKAEISPLDPAECNEIFLKSAGRLPFPSRVDFRKLLGRMTLRSYLTNSEHREEWKYIIEE